MLLEMFPPATFKYGRTRVETEECERLMRLNVNQHCLNNKTSKDYKDKTKRMGLFDNNCSGTQSDILFFVHFLFLCKQHYALKEG